MTDDDWQDVISCAYVFARRNAPRFIDDHEDLAGSLIERCVQSKITHPSMMWNVFKWAATDYYRRRGVFTRDGEQRRPILVPVLEHEDGGEANVGSHEDDLSELDVDDLVRIVHLVNEGDARIVVLLHSGYSQEEIANLLGTTSSNVIRRLRGVAAIASALDGYGTGDGGHRTA